MSRKPFPEDLITQFHHLSLAKTNHVLAVIKTLNFGPEIVAECEKWLVADPLELIKITDPSLVGFPSFVHGDCWMNNMLFKYNSNGQVEDVQFVSPFIVYSAQRFSWTNIDFPTRSTSKCPMRAMV